MREKPKFKGEYKNGKKWNGKGYDEKGNIIYELKNGNGYIKKYDASNDIEFEGEYLNGRKNGKCKEYFLGYLAFVGIYKSGKRNGKGKEYNEGNLIFEGEYKNGKRNGEGKAYIEDRLEYAGEYKNGKKWNGKGYDRKGNIIYEINNGKGYIKEYDEFDYNVLKFEGEYLNGKKNGNGKNIYIYLKIT